MSQYKKSDNTKQKIIDAAIELIEKDGYDNLTIRNLCSRAGVSLNALNYHFTNKETLCLIITQKLPETITDAIAMKYPAMMDADPFMFELSFTMILVETLLQEGYIPSIYRQMYAQPVVEKNITTSMQAWFMKNHRYFKGMVSQQLIYIYANAFTASIISLVEHGTYEIVKNDILKTKYTIANLLCLLLDLDSRDEVIEKAIKISNCIKVKFVGLTTFDIVSTD